MTNTTLDLVPLIRSGDFAALREELVRWRPRELAEAIAELAAEDQVIAFRILPRRVAAAVFEYMPPPTQRALVKAMGQEEVADLLNDMAPDDRTWFLSELPANATKQLLALLTPDEREEAVTLLGYAPGTVGRLMTPHYIAVREDWAVQQVLDYIRERGHNSETLNVLYVVDDAGCLIDDIRTRDFLVAPTSARVVDLMDRRYVTLKATDTQGSAVEVFRREDRSALPVTDTAGVLIGVVTIDDVLDVAEEEATRAIQQIGGSEALGEPYLAISPLRMVRKRAGWLVFLFLGEMLTATAMGFFEKEIARAVVLALFVPLIISSGGNSGSQASTLVIRALAVGELQLRRSLPRAPPGTVRGTRARRHPRGDRLRAHCGLVGVLTPLRSALAPGGAHRGLRARRRGAVGVPRGLGSAIHPAADGVRPGDVVSTVRRDPGRRHRADHLFLRRAGHPSRDIALKGL